MLRGNATERVATSCIKATAVIFTALEHSTRFHLPLQEFLLKNSKNPKTFISGFFITYFLFELTINVFFSNILVSLELFF
ncbi:hypothetical protein SSUA7_0068 [Streptococcus suis A7]|nr:hypothetical protein SSUJS14_0069 [Streptococcus suis JS14]AER14270.1 hypothetical protein SSU12_0069 [Streptococcus suis SS12]AER43405.1 hypothetical protein SSUA7_0068 [Streptococcus suis A7]ARL69092.1 hypothetical protein B9H01_00435 [Streptococcus suis]KPA66322.1 hypothetical protein XK28_01680 [Streptococcus suis]